MKEKEDVENTEEENIENKVIIDRCRSSISSLCLIFFDTLLFFMIFLCISLFLTIRGDCENILLLFAIAYKSVKERQLLLTQ